MDNAATTKPDEESAARAIVYLKEKYFNPSGMYKEGFSLSRELKSAREKLVEYIADPAAYDLTFTSCGTEADNTAVVRLCKAGQRDHLGGRTLGDSIAVFRAEKQGNCRNALCAARKRRAGERRKTA